MSLRSIFKGAMLVTAAAALVSFITLAASRAFCACRNHRRTTK